jgi:hypothetical protein
MFFHSLFFTPAPAPSLALALVLASNLEYAY